MARDRFEVLCAFLHFADNSRDHPSKGEAGHDPLWKIRPLMDICGPTYIASHGPRPELAIDESIIKFKGRLSFRQYLPSTNKVGHQAICFVREQNWICFMMTYDDILWSMERGEITCSVAMDLSAAFDTVHHGFLLDVLQNYFGVQGVPLEWVNPYLSDRQLKVCVSDTYSNLHTFNFSVPQGSCDRASVLP